MIDFISLSALIKHIGNHVQGQEEMQKKEARDQGKQGHTLRSPFCILPDSPGGRDAFFISSRGQAMAEYVIIAGLLMASLGILTVFFVTFKEYGGRILALVSSEYP